MSASIPVTCTVIKEQQLITTLIWLVEGNVSIRTVNRMQILIMVTVNSVNICTKWMRGAKCF